MYKKTECVAMILAGGQGSRLYTLTDATAKPAVSFGGKYRIIDFPLSNCIHSGIFTVGVLTQYQPLVLNEYIGNGQPWDLDRSASGVMVLPPYQGKNGADWYKGTANAIYQNLNFIQRYEPEYVLVLSGDHIYKMDYSKMLQRHKEKNADCTIAVLNVPLEEASRFGIMTTDDDDRIVEFEEKPAQPKSTNASMGIYVFSRSILQDYLERDNADLSSDNDFGKNVIPAMLRGGCRIYAYPFHGYWKDVGTLRSLWEANMDLLGTAPKFRLYDPEWRIFARNNAKPPHRIGDTGRVTNSMVAGGCEIYGIVENSVIGGGVRIERGAYVKDTVIMQDVTVGEDATVNYSIIDSGAYIGAGSVIGRTQNHTENVTVVGGGVSVPPETDIPGGTVADLAYFREYVNNSKGEQAL